MESSRALVSLVQAATLRRTSRPSPRRHRKSPHHATSRPRTRRRHFPQIHPRFAAESHLLPHHSWPRPHSSHGRNVRLGHQTSRHPAQSPAPPSPRPPLRLKILLFAPVAGRAVSVTSVLRSL